MVTTLEIEQAYARIAFPLEIEISEQVAPNRRPIKAVLFRSNVRSIAPPQGSDKPVVIDKAALAKLNLESLIGLPLHATPDLDAHCLEVDGKKIYFSVGAITGAELKDGIVIGEGYLWDLDHPAIVNNILTASKEGSLAVSWEISDVVLKNEGDYYRIVSFKPTGWALLKSSFAAYQSLMPALAAIKNKATYEPSVQSLKVLLDDHRILHAYYATIRRGGHISDWALSEVVKLHARIVDEMIARHVQHRRGESLARMLNEESLPLQTFRFFTDEISTQVQDFLTADFGQLKQWLVKASLHEKIVLEDTPSVPEGVPLAIIADDKVHAFGAVGKLGSKWCLAISRILRKPISTAEFKAFHSEALQRLEFASSVMESLPDTVVVPAYIALSGSSLLTPASQDLDLLICDNGTLRKLANAFPLQGKRLHFTITDRPAGLAIPIYDLVLVKKPRNPVAPLPDDQDRLAEHQTIVTDDATSFVAARMRSLGDLEIYPQTAFITELIPIKRGLLTIGEASAEIETDEGEYIDCSYLLEHRPKSCLYAVAEVWLIDEFSDWAIADCLWWNATKVADLPFKWRLAFSLKLADSFSLPAVEWREILNPREIEHLGKFVMQDSQACYGPYRFVIMKPRNLRET